MSHRVCRWGILSAANIARKNWLGIRNAENSVVTAVASRSLDKAQQFIDECQAHSSFDPKPVAVGSYEELLKRPDVDAVYIPMPTGLRKEWVIRAAEAGKHVLAEKPIGCDSAEAAEMIAACQKHKVQFMDGVMFMHSQRLNKLREAIDDGRSVGPLRRIETSFSFCGTDEFAKSNIRSSGELEPLGCLGDLGWYNIRFSLWVMNYLMPTRVSGRMLNEAKRTDSRASVPTEFSGELFFANGVTASFYCSFLTAVQQWATIAGTAGYIDVQDFVIPYFGNEVSFRVRNAGLNQVSCDFNMEDHTRRVSVPEYSNGWGNAQETNLFRNFSQLVLSGKTDNHWPDIALKTQQVLDACLKSARSNGAIVTL
ncbi:Gfo/Idh/MocA family protein [Schlesneria paludicola]|uniref:Gfo/Idh/MocA family protein n=1 Tax=Schlesneria paludicola TaxID=360056 RepID=UPI00029B0E48|nr:Gfo/Idh/MocA family oxidoreductase [Schlesneria paludicola]